MDRDAVGAPRHPALAAGDVGAWFVYDTDHHFGLLLGGAGTWLFTAARAGGGYFVCAGDGGVFALGDADFSGSTGNIHLNQPIVGMARTATTRGYWRRRPTHSPAPRPTPQTSHPDGGIFAFGDAHFSGSTANLHLDQPVVGMAASPTGNGYWLASATGACSRSGGRRSTG